MANNDSIIGGIMSVIGVIGILLELIYLIIDPIRNNTPFASKQYWALAIPVFLGVAGVLAIITWIGITMIQTPPPEAWDFDDLEDLDEDEDKGEETEEETSASGIDDIDGVTKTNKKTLIDAGYDTKEKLAAATIEELSKLKGIGKVSAEKIINNAKN